MTSAGFKPRDISRHAFRSVDLLSNLCLSQAKLSDLRNEQRTIVAAIIELMTKERKPSILDSENLPWVAGFFLYVLVGFGFFQLSQESNSLPAAVVGSIIWPLTLALGCVVALMGATEPIILGIAALALMVWIIPPIGISIWQKQRAIDRGRHNAEVREQHQLSERRLALAREIRDLSERTDGEHLVLKRHLNSAASDLEIASDEFREKVINPFWEAVERVVQSLGHFESGVTRIRNNVVEHTRLCRELKNTPRPIRSPETWTTPPPLNGKIDQVTFDRAIEIAQRLRPLMREAQKIPVFATVYEQRRTTSAVSMGFSTLSAAVQGMERRITQSLGELSTTFTSSLQELQAAQVTTMSNLAKQVDSSLEPIAKGIKEGNESQEKSHKFLKDYIEERRRL